MQIAGWALRAAGIYAVLMGDLLLSPASAADGLAETAIPTDGQQLPAVDGFNAKVSGFGGGANGNGFYGGAGSVSMPLGFRYGLQIDGVVADANTDTQGNVTAAGTAAHLFWRDPSVGLLGLYGHYLHADAFSGVDVFAGGAEGALYLGRFTLEGVAGAQGGEADLGISFEIDTRFFDVAQLSYYPIDNLKLSIGHNYLFGRNAVLLGAEWGFPVGYGNMGAPFVTARIQEGGDGAVLGGLRLYLGQRGKTLIRRHREDDPPSATFIGTFINIDNFGATNVGGL